jgi:hypothetical protein
MLGCMLPDSLTAQTHPIDTWMTWLIDRLGDEMDEEELVERLSELEIYLLSPIPIRAVSAAYLAELQIFTDDEIRSVTEWVGGAGVVIMTLERFKGQVNLDEATKEFVSALAVFEQYEINTLTQSGQRSRIGALSGYVDFRAGKVFPKSVGFSPDGNYLGTHLAFRESAAINSRHLSARFSRYKMPGERFDYPRNAGPWTGSMVYRPASNRLGATPVYIRSLILGDHRIRSGLGLVAATGSMRIDGTQQRFTQLTSAPVLANGTSPSGKFLRGAAVWIQMYRIDLALSVSERPLSASQSESSFYMPGWNTHIRTLHDLQKHHNIRERSFSMILRGNFSFKDATISSGAAWMSYFFDQTLSRRPGLSYASDVTGNRFSDLSMFSSIRWRHSVYDAEWSRSNHNLGWVQVVKSDFGTSTVGIWARKYPFGFNPRLGNPASAYGGTNESGVGMWFQTRPSNGISLFFWSDRYKSFGPRFGTRLPVKGREWGARARARLGTSQWVEGTIRQRNRLNNGIEFDFMGREVDQRIWTTGTSGNIRVRYLLVKGVQTQFKVSYSGHTQPQVSYRGWGTSALIIVQQRLFAIYAQQSIFNTDDHLTRIYFYEYDMQGSFRIPSVSGHGVRQFLMLHAAVSKGVTLRIKASTLRYSDRVVVGTGADATSGDQRWGFDAQLRIMF